MVATSNGQVKHDQRKRGPTQIGNEMGFAGEAHCIVRHQMQDSILQGEVAADGFGLPRELGAISVFVSACAEDLSSRRPHPLQVDFRILIREK
jgi:hypothetical protein